MSKNMPEEETKKENIIEQNYFKEKTRFEIIEEKVKKTLFGVLNILLKFEDDDFSDEVIDLLNETCQFLYYPFYDPMGYLWKKETLFSGISKFLSYFQTVVFFNNTELYIVFFYIMMAVVLGVVVDVGYVAYIISSKNKSGAVWPMRLLRSVVSYIVTVLFNPMVEYFLAILECSNFDEEGNPLDYYQNYNVDDMHCWTNVHFTVMCVEGVLITVIFVLICTVVMTIFYEQKTSMDKEGAKTSSYADLTSLFVKIILIIIYSFLVWTKSYHWIVVPATTLTCFLQFYVYWTERPFYEERTNIAFFIHTGIVFYSTVVLLLLKILENAAFDGGIFILFIGGVMVTYIIITQKDKRFNLLLMNINKFSEGGSVFKQLRYFLELVDKSHNDRRSNILLKGYIYVHEESCTNSECPLKRYLQEIEKIKKNPVAGDKTMISGINLNTNTNLITTDPTTNINKVSNIIGNTSNIGGPLGTGTGGEGVLGGGNKGEKGKHSHTDDDLYLYQYVMTMYQNGISKFSLSTTLRINYSFFLMERMNNTKKALIELKNCEKYNPSFEEEFIIFRYCENNTAQENDTEEEGDDDEGLDIVANIAYKNHFNTFKEGLTSITSIYYDFWSLLLNNTQNSEEDLAKMNEYGEKINKLVEVVKSHYSEMEKLKYNDEEILKLYADFFQDILNNRSQAEYYRSRLRDIQGEGGQEIINSNDPTDTSNENIDYIFLAGEGSQIGKIVKCSPNFCSILGYTPDELIGKSVNFIMPEIFHSYHQKLLVEKASRFKTQMTQNVRSGVTGNQKSNYKELFVIAKNKQNQAVPLSLKITLIYEHELNELFFIGRLYNEEMYENFAMQNPSPGVPPIINFNMKVCYVLTNLDFIVQYYTPNASNFLGFKMGSSGNVDVTKNITEFNNDDNLEMKHLSKGEILCKRYAQPKLIIWKTLLNDEANNEEGNNPDDVVKKWDMKGFWSYSNELSKKKETVETLEQTLLKRTKIGNSPFVFKRQRYKEDSFKLTVNETSIKGTTLGYIFRFEVFENNDDNEGNNYEEKNQEVKKKDNVVDIDPYFIPQVTRKFALDTNKFGFYSKEQGEEEEEEEEEEEGKEGKNWHENLKKLAEEKINKFKKKQKDLENEEEEMEEEEEDNSQINEDEENEESDMGIYSKKITLNKQSSIMSNESGNLSKPGTMSKPGTLNTKDNKDKLTKQESISNTLIKKEESLINNESIISPIPVAPVQKIKYEFDYYHVQGLSDMRFLIYDFKKGRLVDVPKIKRESQVEYRKKEGIPNFFGNPQKEKIERDINEDDDEQENETAEVKRIEYALQKEQFQPEIVKLKWTSLAIYIAIMAISIILLYLIIDDYKEINENILMINNSRILQTDLLLGLYYIRELTLLSMNREQNKKYKTNLYDEEYSLKNISRTLNELFDRSALLERSLESTKIKWSKNWKNILIKTNTKISILDELNEQLKVINVESKSFSALTELLGNLFEVGNLKSYKEIIQTNRHVYFYTTNIYYPLLDILKQYTDNILHQLKDSIAKFKQDFLLIIIFSIILLLIGGFFIKIILDKISRRKSGYLEVFFQIDKRVCRKALEKCDKYSKVLNQAQGGDEDSINSENNSFIKKNMKQEKKINDITHKNVKPANKKTCINIKTTFEIIFLFLFVFLFYLIVIIIFQQNLDKMNKYSELYNILSLEGIEYQSIFDIMREYFFDYKSNTGIHSFKNILELNLETIYENMKKSEQKFSYDNLPSKFKKKYLEIITNDLCSYAEDLFIKNNKTEYNFNYIISNNYTCEEIAENSTKYGLDLLVSNYLYELRVQKKYFDILLQNAQNENYTYNNTLFGEDKYYNKLLEENKKKENYNDIIYEELDPFNIYNEEHVFKLSMIRRYLLLPIYNDTLNNFYVSMRDFWSTSYDIFLAIMIVFLLLVTAFYLAYWIPSIILQDESIYKTKNMLAIIPKDVLTTIPGINKLLNLGNITLFSGVWNQSENKEKKAKDNNKK